MMIFSKKIMTTPEARQEPKAEFRHNQYTRKSEDSISNCFIVLFLSNYFFLLHYE